MKRTLVDLLAESPIVLARAEQDGYVLEIHQGADQTGLRPGDRERKGTMFITSPEGQTVMAGYWMDWPEKTWKPSLRHRYYHMPAYQRAGLEAHEQLKYGLKKDFEHHLRASGHLGPDPASGQANWAGRQV